MFGLIMVLGMLVDDSIIVAEQYYQNLEEGMKPRDAAKKAAKETLAPITATVITTMVAFGSLFYMDGIMGKFLWSVPAVVIIALAASWLECFIILPAHLADFAHKVKEVNRDRWYQPLLKAYERVLRFSLKHSKLTIGFFIVLFLLSIVTIKSMKFELFPSEDVTRVNINIKGPVGTPIAITNSELQRIESILLNSTNKDEIKSIQTIGGFQSFKGGRSKSGNHYGSIKLELTMQDFREITTDEMIAEISEKSGKGIRDDFSFNIERLKGGPPTGRAINVELRGDDLKELLEVSNIVKKDILGMEGVLTTELDYEIGKKQILIDINEQEARRLGVSNLQIALELRRAFEGEVATTIKKSDEDVDVLIRFEKESRVDEDILKSIRITNNQNRRVKLTQIAKFKEVDGSYLIRRKNRKRTFAITGEVDLKKTTSNKINKEIRPYMENILKDYPELSFVLAGENKDTLDSMKSFKKAMMASMFIIFIMLVAQFHSMAQPLIIMTAIPFGLIGVVAAFKILGMPIGFMALMGMLGLVGVVINDSIVLVTFINRNMIKEGINTESLIHATLRRFRPVILTTFTTVAGLLPIAHMPGGDPFLKPMATSFAYGLLFSSAITLLFVPACYKAYTDLLHRFNKEPVEE